jgi:hypothetical protein
LPSKNEKSGLLKPLLSKEGVYSGKGENQDYKEFQGTLELRSIVNNRGVSLKYKAVGTEGSEFNRETLYNKDTVLYNEEYTLICNNNKNEITLWTLNSNIGTMSRFDLRRYRYVSKDRYIYIFGFGDPEDNNVFREEITIELWENGDLSYNYSWGEAGGHFLSRSTIRMKKIG